MAEYEGYDLPDGSIILRRKAAGGGCLIVLLLAPFFIYWKTCQMIETYQKDQGLARTEVFLNTATPLAVVIHGDESQTTKAVVGSGLRPKVMNEKEHLYDASGLKLFPHQPRPIALKYEDRKDGTYEPEKDYYEPIYAYFEGPESRVQCVRWLQEHGYIRRNRLVSRDDGDGEDVIGKPWDGKQSLAYGDTPEHVEAPRRRDRLADGNYPGDHPVLLNGSDSDLGWTGSYALVTFYYKKGNNLVISGAVPSPSISSQFDIRLACQTWEINQEMHLSYLAALKAIRTGR
jgi:hypothetical protein